MADTSILEKCIILGPWPTCSYVVSNEWIYIPEGFIRKISISHGKEIDAIEFHSDNGEGATEKSCFGQFKGKRTDTICIDYPDEYLTSITGTLSLGLKSLCFHTNQNRYGPYGEEQSSNCFSYDGKGGVIVGFYGRHRCTIKDSLNIYNRIHTIGFYVMPKSLAFDRYSKLEENSRSEKCCKILTLRAERDAGPWGASGGKPWDDGVFDNIKQVRVQLGDPSEVILGIQFKYVKKDGKFILSRLHGGSNGDVSEVEINLDGVKEYLIGISGFYGPVEEFNGMEGITSITFHTNKRKHGPYGQKSSGEDDVSFTSTASRGKVVGFHGRNDGFLTAIGVHMEYF